MTTFAFFRYLRITYYLLLLFTSSYFFILSAAKGSRPCTQECCEAATVKDGAPDSATYNYQMSWGWLMNILIIAHIFSSLLLSPLSMPSLTISNGVSPGFLSSESRTRRHSSQFSIEKSSKDVRWKPDDPITQELQTSSTSRENSAQR